MSRIEPLQFPVLPVEEAPRRREVPAERAPRPPAQPTPQPRVAGAPGEPKPNAEGPHFYDPFRKKVAPPVRLGQFIDIKV